MSSRDKTKIFLLYSRHFVILIRMNISRKKLVNLLKQYPASTSLELSARLDRTPADIRYHLSQLVQEGLVSRSISKTRTSRGRPLFEYSMAPVTKPDNLLNLSCALLAVIQNQPDGWNHLADTLSQDSLQSSTVPARLTEISARLSRDHYEARWEVRNTGPAMIFNNCPYLALLPSFPGLCQMDRKILASWLSVQINERSTIAAGAHQCVFEILINRPD